MYVCAYWCIVMYKQYALSPSILTYPLVMDSELSATRESLELLKKRHEALQRNSLKTTVGLQRKLQVAEEEVARSKVALSMEKHKVTKCYCMIVWSNISGVCVQLYNFMQNTSRVCVNGSWNSLCQQVCPTHCVPRCLLYMECYCG